MPRLVHQGDPVQRQQIYVTPMLLAYDSAGSGNLPLLQPWFACVTKRRPRWNARPIDEPPYRLIADRSCRFRPNALSHMSKRAGGQVTKRPAWNARGKIWSDFRTTVAHCVALGVIGALAVFLGMLSHRYED